MVVLRATAKLLAKLRAPVVDDGASDTALGDWYGTTLVVDRRPLLLLVSSESLLPIVLPARDLRQLPDRLPEVVHSRLERLGTPRDQIAAEVAAMRPVVVAKTASRSVVGIMVESARAIPFYLERGAWDESTLPILEQWLAKTPWHAGRREAVWPDRVAPELLAQRWLSNGGRR